MQVELSKVPSSGALKGPESVPMKSFKILMLAAVLMLSACAHHQRIPPETISTVYWTEPDQDALVYHYAPLFLAHNYQASYNRMGQPSARYDDGGNEQIYIDSHHTSFYHQKGLLKGYVKGSVKPLESIFLSLLSLDFFVGTDKVYADHRESGNPFYTSLKPWNRNASDMRNFAAFLEFWGWQL